MSDDEFANTLKTVKEVPKILTHSLLQEQDWPYSSASYVPKENIPELPGSQLASQIGSQLASQFAPQSAAKPKPSLTILGPQIRTQKKPSPPKKNVISTQFSFLVVIRQAKFHRAGSYELRLHEYCGKDSFKLAVTNESVDAVCIFPVRPSSLRNMAKLPLILEFWLKGETEQFSGMVRYDLARVPKIMKGNEQPLRANLYPLFLNDGLLDVTQVASQRISGRVDLAIAIGTNPQISRYLNEHRTHKSPPPSPQKPDFQVSPSKINKVKEEEQRAVPTSAVAALVRSFEAIWRHGGRLEDLLGEWMSRYGKALINGGLLETMLTSRTALSNELIADSFAVLQNTKLQNIQFLRSYHSYKQLAQTLQFKYSNAVSGIFSNISRQMLDNFRKQRLSQPYFSCNQVEALFLGMGCEQQNVSVFLKMADIQDNRHIKKEFLYDLLSKQAAIPFNQRLAMMIVQERVKDELSCCRVQDYQKLRIQGEREFFQAEELQHVFRGIGLKLAYFETLLLVARIRDIYQQKNTSHSQLGVLSYSCWLSPLIKKCCNERDNNPLKLQQLLSFLATTLDNTDAHSSFEQAAERGFLWKPIQVTLFLRGFIKQFAVPGKQLHHKIFNTAERAMGIYMGTLNTMREDVRKLREQLLEKCLVIIEELQKQHSQQTLQSALYKLPQDGGQLSAQTLIFQQLLQLLPKPGKPAVQQLLQTQTIKGADVDWLSKAVGDRHAVMTDLFRQFSLKSTVQNISPQDINRRFFQISYLQGLLLLHYVRGQDPNIFEIKEEQFHQWLKSCIYRQQQQEISRFVKQEQDRLKRVQPPNLLPGESRAAKKETPREQVFYGTKHVYEIEVQEIQLTKGMEPGKQLRMVYRFPGEQNLVLSKPIQLVAHRVVYPLNCHSKHSVTLSDNQPVHPHLEGPDLGILLRLVDSREEELQVGESLLPSQQLQGLISPGEIRKCLPLFQNEQDRTIVMGKVKVRVRYLKTQVQVQQQNAVVKETKVSVYLPKKGYLNLHLQACLQGELLRGLSGQLIFLSFAGFHQQRRLSRYIRRINSEPVPSQQAKVILQDSINIHLTPDVLQYFRSKSALIELRALKEGEPIQSSVIVASNSFKLAHIIDRTQGIRAHFALKRKSDGQFGCVCKCSLQYDKHRSLPLKTAALDRKKPAEPELTFSFLQFIDYTNRLFGKNGQLWFQTFSGGQTHESPRIRLQDKQLITLTNCHLKMALTNSAYINITLKYQEYARKKGPGLTVGSISVNMRPVLNAMESSSFVVVSNYYLVSDEEMRPTRARVGMKILVNLPDTQVEAVNSLQDIQQYEQLVEKYREGLNMTASDFEDLQLALLRKNQRFPADLFTKRIHMNLDFLQQISADRLQLVQRFFSTLDEAGSGMVNKFEILSKWEQNAAFFGHIPKDILTLFLPKQLDFFKHDRTVFILGLQSHFDYLIFQRKLVKTGHQLSQPHSPKVVLHDRQLHYTLQISKVINPPGVPYFISSPSVPLMSEVFPAGESMLQLSTRFECRTEMLQDMKNTAIQIFTQIGTRVKYHARGIVDLLALDRTVESVHAFGEVYLVMRGWVQKGVGEELVQEEDEDEDGSGKARKVANMLKETLRAEKQSLFQQSIDSDDD